MFGAGGSGDKVELEVGPPDATARVVFTVANVRTATHELRKRGFKVQKSPHVVSVTDPDGAVIVFVAPTRGTGS